VGSSEIAETAQTVHALKAEMDRSLSLLRAWAVRLDQRLRETRDSSVGADTLRALGQMVGGMAHNLNNALAAILGYTELLLKDPLDDRTERRLTIIRQVALEAGLTVRRLQELAARQPEGAPGPVSLAEVATEALETTQPRWRDESERRGVSITVERELDPALAVEGNRGDLRQVLVHLILNALDAMPAGGVLRLRTRSVEAGWVELEVADTGAPRPGGLSEASAIVQDNGGQLSVESAAGQGTRVRLRLPESRFDLIPAAGALEPCAPEQARKILLVDDDPRLLRVLTDLLEASGHQVVMAGSGPEGLSRLEAEEVDLVITDLGMPGMTGWELAERVKARLPETPVFLLTGWGRGVAAADAGRFVDRIIAKPVSADAILGHLGEVPRRAGPVAS
jgi:CheY-like chemotaxis protein